MSCLKALLLFVLSLSSLCHESTSELSVMADEIIEDGVPLPNPEQLPSGGDFQMPSIDELLKALDKMEMPDESKDELRASLLAKAQNGENLFQSPAADFPEAKGTDMLTLFIMLAIIIMVFVFFGYKLYKALTDRERRKEEKKRQKQQKKKK